MDVEAALELAEALVFAQTGKHLNDLQRCVFREAWQCKSFTEIAESCNCNESHAKEIGSHLWKLLSSALGEQVSKKSFKAGLERRAKAQLSGKIPISQAGVADGVQPSALDPNFVGRESALANPSQPVSSSVPGQQNYSETRQRGAWIADTRCRQVWGRENLIEQILNRLDDPQELSIL